MKKIIYIFMVIILGLSLSGGVAHASSSMSTVGEGQETGLGLNLNAYCLSIGQGFNASVILGTQNWTCSSTGVGPAFRLHDACMLQHPGFDSVKEAVKGNPYTWQCYE